MSEMDRKTSDSTEGVSGNPKAPKPETCNPKRSERAKRREPVATRYPLRPAAPSLPSIGGGLEFAGGAVGFMRGFAFLTHCRSGLGLGPFR